MNEKIRVLHISDIHYSKIDLIKFNELVKKPLFKSLQENSLDESIDLICLSGDLINQGTGGFSSSEEAFNEFKENFIKPLSELLSINTENILFCPGNHDVNRELDRETEDKIKNELNDKNKINEIISNCHSINEYEGIKRLLPFKNFEKDFYEDNRNSNISFFESYHRRKIKNLNIGILSLNSVWRCFDDDSKILLGKQQIVNHRAELEQNSFNILISHYPLENCSDIDTPISELITPFNLCCYGHKHSMDSILEQTIFGDKVVKNSAKGLMAYNVHETDLPFLNGFTIIDLNFNEQLATIEVRQFLYSSGNNTFGLNNIETGSSNPVCFNINGNSTSCLNFDRNKYLENIKAQAGKRYTPELNVDVSVYQILDCFSKKKDINNKLRNENERIQTYKNNQFFDKPLELDDEEKKIYNEDELNSQVISEKIELINSTVHTLNGSLDINYLYQLRKISTDLFHIITKRAEIEFGHLRKKYGDKINDPRYVNPQEKETLNYLNSCSNSLEIFNANLCTKNFEAFYTKTLYIIGPGGIGKTHCLVDYSCNNTAIFVFFGEDFSISEPWIVMKEKLGLPSSLTKKQLFDFFSNEARKNQKTGIICIDAVNESQNIDAWNKWIPVLCSDISAYDNLKLCISCRDTYINVISDILDNWIEYIHNGFMGKEYLAVDMFCEHYKILPPSFPYISPEVCNPLILQMICENLVLEGETRFLNEQIGIKGIFEKYVANINKKISKPCDFDYEDELVQKFILEIAKTMINQKNKLLTYNEYKSISNKIYQIQGYKQSLAKQCENESLFTRISKNGQKYIRFTYERFCDFYIAKAILDNGIENCISEERILVKDSSILEMLATLIPEENENKEIVDYDNSEYSKRAFLQSLPIRSPKSVSDRTKQFIVDYISEDNDSISILISIGATPNNPLNIIFFSELLEHFPLCERDSFFSQAIIKNYENEDTVKILIDTSYNKNLSIYSHESKFLWVLTLAQLCSVPDRRIRDQASKAITVLLVSDISLCVELIKIFIKYKDEYIIERIVASIYSSFLITKEIIVLKKVSEYIIQNNLLSLYSNILIQEHLEFIIDLAIKNEVLPPQYALTKMDMNKESFHVPEINEYNEIVKDTIYQNTNINFVDHWYTDFQRYILYNRIEDFDFTKANIDINDIYRWFVVELKKIGYPGKNKIAWEYDTKNINEYGSGRGKIVYPERLSKKYYWIFLHRLVGLLKNTCPLKENSYSYKEFNNTILFSLQERDIDLSDIRFAQHVEYPQLQIKRNEIGFAVNPKQWVETEVDFIDELTILNGFNDCNQQLWIPLNYVQKSKIELRDKENGYQESIILISASIISKTDLERLDLIGIKKLTEGNVFQNITQDYTLYLGEYPFSKSYEYLMNTEERTEYEYRSDNIKIYPSTYEMLRGREWEYDCSFESQNCLFPSTFLIDNFNLKWDSNCGWYVKDKNELAYFSTIINGSSVAFLRKNLLSELNDKFCLIFRVYQEKIYSPSMFKAGGLHSIRSIYQMNKSGLRKLIKFDDDNWFNQE